MKNNKTSKAITTFIVVIMMLCAVPVMDHFGVNIVVKASALSATGQCGDNVYWNFDSSTGKLTISGSGATYDYGWLDTGLFSDCPELKHVIIEDGVTSIGSYLFWNVASIESITFANSIKIIKKNAFVNCKGLKYLKLPTGLTEICEDAFYGCDMIKKIDFNEGLKTIGKGAFWSCTSLEAVILPDSVTSLGNRAFNDCSSVVEIKIGKGISVIPNSAFYGCNALTEVYIPESVSEINSAFGGCYSLEIAIIANPNCKFTGYGGVEFPVKTVIYGHPGSTAEAYAQKNSRTFKNISELHTHSYTSKVTKAATCTSTGVMTYTCSCGDSYTKTIEKTGHTYVSSTTKAATCTTSGVKTYKCKCGDSYTKTISKTGHKYKTTTTKATTSKDGKVVKACTGCSKKSTTTIYKIKTIKLSSTKYTYTGKKKTPTVTVTDSKGNKLKKDTDYTLKYSSSSRKSIGNYNVKITFKGKYSGSKTLTFQITPGKVTGVKQDTNKRGLYVYWSKVTKAAGYEIWEYSNGEWRKLTESKECSKYNASVNAAYTKTYGPVKWKIRAYTKVDGKKIYGSFSDVKTFYGVG